MWYNILMYVIYICMQFIANKTLYKITFKFQRNYAILFMKKIIIVKYYHPAKRLISHCYMCSAVLKCSAENYNTVKIATIEAICRNGRSFTYVSCYGFTR